MVGLLRHFARIFLAIGMTAIRPPFLRPSRLVIQKAAAMLSSELPNRIAAAWHSSAGVGQGQGDLISGSEIRVLL